MTFLELQNAVLKDRFGETRRGDIKNWLNYRYGRLWSLEDWTFKRSLNTVTLLSGQGTAVFSGFQRILGVWDGTTGVQKTPLDAIRAQHFYDEAVTTLSVPAGYTLVGNTILFDTYASGNKTYTVLGELAFTPLVADVDVPLLPVEFHMLLVSGAIAQGLRDENDPTWNAMEADFQAGTDDMKKGYLVNIRETTGAYPDWP